MRRFAPDAALAVVVAALAAADAAGALAGQVRGNLAVTVRVVDQCRATSTGAAVGQSCGSRAQVHGGSAVVAGDEPAPRAGQLVGARLTAEEGVVTVIY